MKTRIATRNSAKGKGIFKTKDMITGSRRPAGVTKRKSAFRAKVIESIIDAKTVTGKTSPRRRLLNLRSHRKMVIIG